MLYTPMKRSKEAERDAAMTSMANCLMLLSSGRTSNESYDNTTLERVFKCKTCNRHFTSFQALGGHRASHKKLRLNSSHGTNLRPAKPKSHECSICGLEFSIGQALGGHMRRHRATLTNENRSFSVSNDSSAASVVKKVNRKRVLSLDLNLTPLENDLEFEFRKVVPATIELFI